MMRWSYRRSGGIRVIGLAALVLVGTSRLAAQQPPQAPTGRPRRQRRSRRPSGQAATEGGPIRLLAGRSMILTTDFDLKQVTLTNPAVADATALSARELLIDGKAPGTISLFAIGDIRRVHYELIVEPGVTVLEQRLRELFPGEDLKVGVSEGAIVLSGRASTNEVMLRAGEIASSSFPTLKVINMLQLPGGGGSQQVMLQVRFAEVNKRAVEELGLNMFATRAGFTGRATTQQFPAPDFEDDALNGVGRPGVQRLPEHLLLPAQRRHRRRVARAQADGRIPEPGRAEPDCLQRTGSDVPVRRRVSDSDRLWQHAAMSRWSSRNTVFASSSSRRLPAT